MIKQETQILLEGPVMTHSSWAYRAPHFAHDIVALLPAPCEDPAANVAVETGTDGIGADEENGRLWGGGAKNKGERDDVPTNVAAHVDTLPTIGMVGG